MDKLFYKKYRNQESRITKTFTAFFNILLVIRIGILLILLSVEGMPFYVYIIAFLVVCGLLVDAMQIIETLIDKYIEKKLQREFENQDTVEMKIADKF